MEYSYLSDGTRTAALDSDGEGLVYRGPFTYRRSASGALTLEAAACPEGLLTDGEVLLHVTDHLGSTMAVMRGSDGALYEASEYDAYGKRSSLTVSGAAALPDGVTLRARFTGKEDQAPDFGIGYTDFGARLYSPASRRWMVPDPLSEKYYGISPYAYCAGNPVNFVDPDGRNPIYGTNGRFLGTDDRGVSGDFYVMDVRLFSQGMSHESAASSNIRSSISRGVIDIIESHYESLRTRPDYDGYVTVMEGVSWAKSHPNALSNPTPDNMLYIDSSKLDFGSISSVDFPEVNVLKGFNLFNIRNTLESISNERLRSTVYALGVVNLVLTDRNNRSVMVVNDSATDYDWNEGGGKVRDLSIRVNNFLFRLNPDVHGFKAYYYGEGILKQ